MSSLLSRNVALVKGPCFCNTDLVVLSCHTFPRGLEHRTGKCSYLREPPNSASAVSPDGLQLPSPWTWGGARTKAPWLVQPPLHWYSQSKNLKIKLTWMELWELGWVGGGDKGEKSLCSVQPDVKGWLVFFPHCIFSYCFFNK